MNREEIDKEARATKNTRNTWKWIIGIGVVLMLIAFWGGFFNHDENFSGAETPSATAPDTLATDTVGTETNPDTVMENVRDTQ
ncbi:hypothetical protein [Dyadobacter helix]|nr:hypothetical protein [Dyadobacter sp. CECT 9275]